MGMNSTVQRLSYTCKMINSSVIIQCQIGPRLHVYKADFSLHRVEVCFTPVTRSLDRLDRRLDRSLDRLDRSLDFWCYLGGNFLKLLAIASGQ